MLVTISVDTVIMDFLHIFASHISLGAMLDGSNGLLEIYNITPSDIDQHNQVGSFVAKATRKWEVVDSKKKVSSLHHRMRFKDTIV